MMNLFEKYTSNSSSYWLLDEMLNGNIELSFSQHELIHISRNSANILYDIELNMLRQIHNEINIYVLKRY